jgi:hypothetical protein
MLPLSISEHISGASAADAVRPSHFRRRRIYFWRRTTCVMDLIETFYLTQVNISEVCIRENRFGHIRAVKLGSSEIGTT